MKKGRFGIVLSFYVILAFICVILKLPILCALLLGFVVLAEKDEWAGRQVLQALLLSIVVTFFNDVVTWGVSFISLPFLSGVPAMAASVISILVYVAAIVLSILAILRVMKDEEADLPLFADLAYRAYGVRKPKPAPGQYPPPYTPGVQQPGQPVPPQYGSPAAPPVPPQYGAPQDPGQSGGPQAGGPQNGGPHF